MENQNVLEVVCKEKHKKVEADTCRIEKRVDRHGEEIDSLKELMAVQTAILEKVTKMVDEIQARPGRRWESVVSQVITLIVAFCFGFLINRVGG